MRVERLNRFYGRHVGRYAAAGLGAPTPLSDPNVTAVDSEGWRAAYTSPPNPGNFDPVGDPKKVVVLRPGFTAAGAATTVTDELTILSRVRLPSPDEATWTSNDVSLSGLVFANDNIVGVTNGSLEPYPAPACCWGHADLRITTDGSIVARLYVSHLFARNGRPVAAVKFIVSDGSSGSVERLVTTMTSVQHSGSGLYAPYFEHTFTNLATLAAGACKLNAIVYPWCGDAYDLDVDGDGERTIAPGAQTIMNDHDGSYGQAHAMVDPASTEASAQVYATEAAMTAAHTGDANTAFATIAAALAAIEAYNFSTHGRANDPGGGVAHLQHGDYVKANWIQDHDDFPVAVCGASGTTRSLVKLQTPAATASNTPAKLRLADLTIEKLTAGTQIAFRGSATLANKSEDRTLIFERVTGLATAAAYEGTTFLWHRMFAIDCDGDDLGLLARAGANADSSIAIGCLNWASDSTYSMVACKSLGATVNFQPIPPNDETNWPVGPAVVGHCFLGSQGDVGVWSSSTENTLGHHFACTIFEKLVQGSVPAVKLNADGDLNPTDNLLLTCVTVVGQRVNFLYNDVGSAAVKKRGCLRFCVTAGSYNSKDDTFPPTDGARVGNWQAQYRAGFRSNAHLIGSQNAGASFGVGNIWLGETSAPGDVAGDTTTPLDANWADDQSAAGAAGGDGDYRPGTPHDLPSIPAGLAPYPIDFLGQAIPNDGSAVVGALQPI